MDACAPFDQPVGDLIGENQAICGQPFDTEFGGRANSFDLKLS